MQRNPDQILLDRLLVRAAVAKKPLETLLVEKERQELAKIQKQITPETKSNIIPGLDSIVKKLGEALNTREVARVIKDNFMKEGIFSQENALRLIYPQDPRLVIPVIGKVIEDLLEKAKKRHPHSTDTKAFLEAALVKVKEVDEKQNRSKAAQVSLLGELTKERISADMIPLINLISKVTFAEDEALAWFEAILWLEGHFLREHNKALLKGGGKLQFTKDPEIVAPIDEEDETLCNGKGVPFWNGTGSTKHFINSHFHAIAILLARKMKAHFKLSFIIDDVFPTRIVMESDIKDNTLSSSAHEHKHHHKEERKSARMERMAPVIPFVSDEALPYKTQLTSEGKLCLTTYLPAECSPEQIEEAMRAFSMVLRGGSLALGMPHGRRESILARLKYSQTQGVAEKNLFGFMILAFKECELTGREDEIIHSHMPEFEVLVDQNYTKASRSGLKLRLYGDRTHAADVAKMFEYFKATDEEGKRRSVLEIITCMQNVWQKANADNSTLLYAVLEETVKKMRDTLILHLDSDLQLASSLTSSGAAPRKMKHH